MQRGDVALAETEFLEHRVGMLAELRWPHHELRRRARQRDALADEAHLALVLPGHALRDAEMLHLRIGEHFVDGIDRPARTAGRVQALDPLRAGAADEALVDVNVERVAVLRARRAVDIVRVFCKLRRLDGVAEPFPDRLPR